MIWVPGMSEPHFVIESITFFSASSPSTFLGSPLNSKVGGAKTTFDVFSFSVKNSATESPEESPGAAVAGRWTDKAILFIWTKVKSGFCSSEINAEFL